MNAVAASTFDDMVALLQASGFSRDVAEREVRKQYPKLVAPINAAIAAAEDERQLNLLEKEEQAYIAKLFKGFGCRVYNLSQARASKQTPGLPDLWVVAQWRDRRDARPDAMTAHVAFWFEVKRSSGGRVSDAQRAFREECEAASIRHYLGDRRAAARVLLDIGLARVGDGPCGIVPFHEGR